jgi:hypothetical protein
MPESARSESRTAALVEGGSFEPIELWGETPLTTREKCCILWVRTKVAPPHRRPNDARDALIHLRRLR